MDFVSHTDIAEDFAGALEARAKSFPEFAEELRMFRPRWIETLGGPIEENVALLRRLRASGKPVYALSNFATVNVRAGRAPPRFSERIRRPRHFRPCRRRQAGAANLPDPVRTGRQTAERTVVHRRFAEQHEAPPKRSACQRSTSPPASIWSRSSSPAAPCPEAGGTDWSLILHAEAALFQGGDPERLSLAR